jgi:hypothetical protein
VPPPPPPKPKPPDGGGGSGYIDPSGDVVTAKGAPLPGATVVLLAGTSAQGPLSALPDGSPTMSPSNRRNPDRTNALGHFGWDVLPGFYRVTATHAGCTAAHGSTVSTGILPVPPPVADLRLVLSCPRLRRAATTLSVTVAGRAGGTTLSARVGSPRRPAGFVTFRVGRKVLGEAVLDSRTRAASLTTARTLTPRSVVATYSGDGANAPSRGGGVAPSRAVAKKRTR